MENYFVLCSPSVEHHDNLYSDSFGKDEENSIWEKKLLHSHLCYVFTSFVHHFIKSLNYGDGDYCDDDLTIYCSSLSDPPSNCQFTHSELLCWVTFHLTKSHILVIYAKVPKVPWVLWCEPPSLLEFAGRPLSLDNRDDLEKQFLNEHFDKHNNLTKPEKRTFGDLTNFSGLSLASSLKATTFGWH